MHGLLFALCAALAQASGPASPSPSGAVSGPDAAAPAGAVARAALTLVSSGAAARLGRYFPSRAEAAAPGEGVRARLPADIGEPLVGTLPINGGTAFVMGKGPGGTGVLVVDTNGNGDLRDDARAGAAASQYGAQKQRTRLDGTFVVNIGTPGEAHGFRWFRFDPADPERADQARTVHFYRDYAREGRLTLGGKEYGVLLADDRNLGKLDNAGPGSLVNLYIDLDGNGVFDPHTEVYDTTQPFAVGGQAYEVKAIGAGGVSLAVVTSDKQVDERFPPPDLRVGGMSTPFTGTTPAGKTVRFPQDYRGKVVLLDFWATWCMPCQMEMPNVVRAKKDFSARGFEVLGISLDQKDAGKKITDTAERLHMDWEQVYDGGFWASRVPQLYQISSIPAAYLVDGDTGRILAMGADVRGEKLAGAVEQALQARQGAGGKK